MFYTLLQAMGNGHTYLPEEELLANASELLKVDSEHMGKHIMDLQMERKLIIKEKDEMRIVFPSQFFYMELNTARMLHDLNLKDKVPTDKIKARIKRILMADEMELDELQEQAVIEAVNNGLLIVTGGPGTGKTTLANIIANSVGKKYIKLNLLTL